MKNLVFIIVAFLIVGCNKGAVRQDVTTLSVNEGTNTAVVRILLAKDGTPFVDTDPIVVNEGQRVVWAGPTDMSIKFPKGSPFSKDDFNTRNAVINNKVPKLKSWAEAEEFKEFKYDVIVGGVVLDPILIIRRKL